MIGDEFGWDNEFEAHEQRVADFAIDNYNVKNRDFMSFVQAGGYSEPSLWDAEGWAWKEKEDVQHPAFWRRSGNLWMYRTMFGDIQLPMDWPVYVSHAEATAYAKWLGRKLPTEEQISSRCLTPPRTPKWSASIRGATKTQTAAMGILISCTGIRARSAPIRGS